MSVLPWIGFIVLVLLLLALDLGVLNRRAHTVSTSRALRNTGLWVSLALAFNVAVYFMYEHRLFGIGTRIGQPMSGGQAALQFLTAYVVEESLSVDNLFVMAMIFRYFAVPEAFQHRVLFLGILGALVFRGVFIGAGLAFIHHFTWAIYVFGGLLVLTALKMLLSKDETLHPDRHPLVRIVRHFYPMTSEYHGDRFFVRVSDKAMEDSATAGTSSRVVEYPATERSSSRVVEYPATERSSSRLYATPLCLALVLVEGSDIVFAVDSVPAVFAVTRDPFIAFTSNVFAMLGLRSLYFALAAALHSFRYLKVSLVFILGFVGVKMLLTEFAHIDTLVSLAVIAGMLGAGVAASLVLKPDDSLEALATGSVLPDPADSADRLGGDSTAESAGRHAKSEQVRPSGSD
jgi:tellurite resistance protein TerC